MAPPLWANRNDRGELQKQKFGPWIGVAFRLLARLKGLRGSPLDVFGYTVERRGERALVQEYKDAIAALLPSLGDANRGVALEFARLPEHIRGFGHVRARHLAAVRAQWGPLLARYRSPLRDAGTPQTPVKAA